nr:hypothetical protein CPGR_01946 [Mycolicibacterium komanii]
MSATHRELAEPLSAVSAARKLANRTKNRISAEWRRGIAREDLAVTDSQNSDMIKSITSIPARPVGLS